MIAVLFSAIILLLGIAMIVRTLAEGIGGGMGLLLGALFVVAGAGRLLLTWRS